MKSNPISKNIMRPVTKKNIITLTAIAVIFILLQVLVSADALGSLFEGLLVPACIYIILALSLNIVVGYLGELSLGHAGFMCIGAYTSSIFSICMNDTITNSFVRFFLALLIGGLFAAIFGFVIGIPVLRLRGDYLAIVTLAFGEIIKNVVNSLYIGVDKTGLHFSVKDTISLNMDPSSAKVILDGAQGISGTPRDANFTVAFLLIIVTLIVIMTLVDSKAGRAITAIRDNRIAAESIGINVTKYKLAGFVISAFFAGLAGVLYSHNYAILSATTKNFGYNQSIMVLVFVVLGGMGNLRGTIIATSVLYLLPEVLRKISPEISDYRMLIYAIILIAMMIFSNDKKIKDFTSMFLNKFLRKKASAAGNTGEGN